MLTSTGYRSKIDSYNYFLRLFISGASPSYCRDFLKLSTIYYIVYETVSGHFSGESAFKFKSLFPALLGPNLDLVYIFVGYLYAAAAIGDMI